ncbi:MAG: hypothetical protein KBT05_00875 [Bacteroidales bacterium]|nr:hypothetical protein [Candidatus Cryptobacteroides caccocaballi]
MISILQRLAHPIDSAFVEGALLLPTEAKELVQNVSPGHWEDSMTLIIFAAISLLVGMTMIQRLINIMPSLLGCFIRWKECINLEASAQLSRDRDIVAKFAPIPLCMVAANYSLWEISLMQQLGPGMRFLCTFGAFLLYLGIRFGLHALFRPRSTSSRTYNVATKAFDTFLISATILTLFSAAVMGVFRCEYELIRTVLFYEICGIYAIHFLRKSQILGSSMSLFSTFLYLCGLEILPTGIFAAVAAFL